MASKLLRRPRLARPVVAAAVCSVLLLAGCSQSAAELSDEELRNELIRVMSEGGLQLSQAGCIADTLFRDAPRDQINRLADAQDLEDLSDEDSEVLFAVIIDCV